MPALTTGGTSDTTWTIWVDCGTSTSTTSTWTYWCDGTGSTTASTDTTWTTWTNEVNHAFAAPREPTAVERAADEARQRQWREIAEKERKAKEAAEARAEKLLLENLSLKQRQDYEQHKHFVIERGDRRYRVRRGRTGNVDVIGKDGRVTHRLCAHPAPQIPDCDTMLAQKLMLEHDEERFTKIANRHAAHDVHPVLPAIQ